MMLLNRTIRNMIKDCIFKLMPHDRILFESYPDFSDNTRYVFNEMVRRGYNKRYKLIWVMQDDDPEKCPCEENVSCIPMNVSKVYAKQVRRAKAVISCNRILCSYVPEQFSIYLDHGTPFKKCNTFLNAPRNAHLGYYLSSSPQTEELRREFLRLRPDTHIISFGFPRNDDFFRPKFDLHVFFPGEFKRFIAWYPTFRNHKYDPRNEGGDPMPLIHNEANAAELDRVARGLGVLIILKPHPVQDLHYMKKLKLNNVVFIDDSFFDRAGIANYEFLNSCDALLSDYSSVFLDYLLADKPIGLVWEDFAQYQSDLGLIDSYEYLASGCEKIYTLEDLKEFVSCVARNEDRLCSIRRNVRDYVHLRTNGQSTKHVVDFIVDKAGL